MKINYSFKLSPLAPAPAQQPEKLVEYSYNEFFLDLPEHWRQIPTAEERTLNWHSEVENASVTISVDFYEVPEEKALKLAEVCVNGRNEAMESLAPGKVSVLQRSIKPYSGGGALEMAYAAQIPDHTYLYLGYVSARKVFNFGLTCGPDRFAASELYNRFMRERLRVKLP
jgi:hypothetical protein